MNSCCDKYGPPDEQHLHRNSDGWITESCKVYTTSTCKCEVKHTKRFVGKKVLITSVGRKVSLVKAFKEAGWYVIGQDLNKDSVALKFCDEVGDKNSDYDLVVPTRDAELIEWAGNPKAMVPSKETIEICRNKLMLGRVLNDIGLKAPKVLFCKPSDGAGSRNSMMVYQEMLEGEEYSMDLFADFNGNVISVVPRKRVKILNGEACVTNTVTLPILVEESMKLSKELNLIGHNVLQCILVDGVPIWTDVNCRLGGASIVGIKAGCKSPEYLLKLINGEKVKPCIGDYKVGLIGRSYTEWTFED